MKIDLSETRFTSNDAFFVFQQNKNGNDFILNETTEKFLDYHQTFLVRAIDNAIDYWYESPPGYFENPQKMKAGYLGFIAQNKKTVHLNEQKAPVWLQQILGHEDMICEKRVLELPTENTVSFLYQTIQAFIDSLEGRLFWISLITHPHQNKSGHS